MLMFCSTLNSRLLLPPSTRPVIGSVGPIVRMSKPRTLYSPPRNSFSKIGSWKVPPIGLMNSSCPREAERHPAVLPPEVDALEHRLVEVRVAAEAGQVDRGREPLAGGREDRLIDGVVDDARRDLADDALAADADEQRVAQERVAREAAPRSWYASLISVTRTCS